MNNTGLWILIITSIIIVVILNLIIPQIFLQVATDEEKDINVDDMDLKSNFMKLMVFNSKLPFTSSLVLALSLLISVYLGSYIKIRPTDLKSIY